MDVDRRPTGRVRASLGRLRARLAGPGGDAPPRGVAFATITHAAGISSTGDDELDRRLPFDEPYRIPPATAAAIRRSRTRGGRIVAIGTTVVRALEHAATRDGRVRAGDGLATQRIGPATVLHVVDAILSGTHEPGTSHYDCCAFTDQATLVPRATKWPHATIAPTSSAIQFWSNDQLDSKASWKSQRITDH